LLKKQSELVVRKSSDSCQRRSFVTVKEFRRSSRVSGMEERAAVAVGEGVGYW
jgi:hypothetical protein